MKFVVILNNLLLLIPGSQRSKNLSLAKGQSVILCFYTCHLSHEYSPLLFPNFLLLILLSIQLQRVTSSAGDSLVSVRKVPFPLCYVISALQRHHKPPPPLHHLNHGSLAIPSQPSNHWNCSTSKFIPHYHHQCLSLL